MISVSDSATILRPRAEVYAFVADLDNLPRWQSEVVSTHVATQGPVRVGMRFTEDVRIGRETVEAHCEITELAEGTLLGFTASSPALDYSGKLDFTDADGGTRVDITATFALKGARRLLEPAFGGEVRRGVGYELDTLKRLLEEGDRRPS
ncbi:MAG: SRPBCC family protein [Pseudolysinimonas sp.]|uniref:SRPBCC family protein n=1 Tax=Pseudolysinimonas sp. TaxID=2680009 RepID=UPI003C78FAF5